jgi:hypothetical protein
VPPAGPQWVRGLRPLEPQPLAYDKPLGCLARRLHVARGHSCRGARPRGPRGVKLAPVDRPRAGARQRARASSGVASTAEAPRARPRGRGLMPKPPSYNLTRSVRDLGTVVETSFKDHALLSVAEQVDTRTSSGRLVLNVLAPDPDQDTRFRLAEVGTRSGSRKEASYCSCR